MQDWYKILVGILIQVASLLSLGFFLTDYLLGRFKEMFRDQRGGYLRIADPLKGNRRLMPATSRRLNLRSERKSVIILRRPFVRYYNKQQAQRVVDDQNGVESKPTNGSRGYFSRGTCRRRPPIRVIE
jgi:hypothetical protein